MTQKERQERSRKEILQAAVQEFGDHNYADVTMEGICSGHGISKGMLYHYFSSKDELFLLCVKEVFQQLEERILHDAAELSELPPMEQIRNYFMIREYFFQLHPGKKRIFENALFRTPQQLTDDIQQLRQPLRNLNREFLGRMIMQFKLRRQIQQPEAMRYIESIEFIFWKLLMQYRPVETDFDLHDFSIYAQRLLDMVLFGILEQPLTERSGEICTK